MRAKSHRLGPWKLALSFLSFLSILYILKVGAFTFQMSSTEEIRQAIRQNNFAEAIKICREKLRQDPENYELNFLLSQAYAFSNRWDEALVLLGGLAARFPQNVDVLLLRARIQSWKKNYGLAEVGYQRVLELAPANIEALTGLAELASWRGEYERSIALYEQIAALQQGQSSGMLAETFFRIGRVHLWSGNYERAREYFRRALQGDPSHQEYRRALESATPRRQEKYEFRYEHQVEDFSDDRPNYIDDRLACQIHLPRPGTLIFRVGQTERFQQKDYQFDVELYPRLWHRAYAYLNAGYSPKAIHFPDYSYLFEVCQGIFTSWEASMGYRRMAFATGPASVYFASLAYYFGKQMAVLRGYHTPHSEGQDFSWTVTLRRYFSSSNYVYLGYGQGSKPFDLVTYEDYLVGASRVFVGGVDWLLLKRLRLQLHYIHREEGPLTRNLLSLTIGIGVGPR